MRRGRFGTRVTGAFTVRETRPGVPITGATRVAGVSRRGRRSASRMTGPRVEGSSSKTLRRRPQGECLFIRSSLARSPGKYAPGTTGSDGCRGSDGECAPASWSWPRLVLGGVVLLGGAWVVLIALAGVARAGAASSSDDPSRDTSSSVRSEDGTGDTGDRVTTPDATIGGSSDDLANAGSAIQDGAATDDSAGPASTVELRGRQQSVPEPDTAAVDSPAGWPSTTTSGPGLSATTPLSSGISPEPDTAPSPDTSLDPPSATSTSADRPPARQPPDAASDTTPGIRPSPGAAGTDTPPADRRSTWRPPAEELDTPGTARENRSISGHRATLTPDIAVVSDDQAPAGANAPATGPSSDSRVGPGTAPRRETEISVRSLGTSDPRGRAATAGTTPASSAPAISTASPTEPADPLATEALVPPPYSSASLQLDGGEEGPLPANRQGATAVAAGGGDQTHAPWAGSTATVAAPDELTDPPRPLSPLRLPEPLPRPTPAASVPTATTGGSTGGTSAHGTGSGSHSANDLAVLAAEPARSTARPSARAGAPASCRASAHAHRPGPRPG